MPSLQRATLVSFVSGFLSLAVILLLLGVDFMAGGFVAFIRHLPALSPAELLAMETANPISPSERQERRQEDDFLNGGPVPGKGTNR